MALFAFAQQPEQTQQLEALQKELAARQQHLAQRKTSAEELEGVLKNSELAIARTVRSLNNTQNELKANNKEQVALRTQQQNLEQRIRDQQSHLAAQLKSAYMAGNYDYAKMVFNQDNALQFERVLTYYQYFSRARQTAINQFREDIAELESVKERLVAAAHALQKLESKQRQQRAELTARQKDRKLTLARLNQQIKTESQAVAELQRNEQALIKAIEAARQAAESGKLSLSGLTKAKGKLIRPAKGPVQRLFGKRRQGQLRWKGVVIEGRAGSPVLAIHEGKVLYADWLKGFGLVSIIDHGEGYMSVYGHNQALLKQAGDLVSAGETIGLVGQSGGQAYPNLYFEIRLKGKALNPTKWVKF